MLASASIGAIWSSCSPDFGIKGVLDRFKQIEPKIIIAADGYKYNGKVINLLSKLKGILSEIPSIKSTVIIPIILDGDIKQISNLENPEEIFLAALILKKNNQRDEANVFLEQIINQFPGNDYTDYAKNLLIENND